jgi:nucleoside-diphosphate-sugar epimerase
LINILVTGGAGYIGSVLVEELLRKHDNRHAFGDVHVTVIDSFMYDQPSLSHLCHDSRLHIIRGDARDMRIMKRHLGLCDVFIPLAALVGADLCDQRAIDAQNTNFTAIDDAMKILSPVQRVIYPNTNSGYGLGLGGTMCVETDALQPISHYGRTKCAAELRVLTQRSNNIVFRLATVFGMSPRMRMDLLVNNFVWRAVTDRCVTLYEPHAMRNYIHVRDVARAFIHAIKYDLPGGDIDNEGVYNVGLSSANMSKLELALAIKKQVHDFEINCAAFNTDPDKRDYVVSNAKIEATDFMPVYSIDAGIAELINGYHQFKKTQYGNV